MSEQMIYACATVAGVDHDDLAVFFEIERPEPDVNFAGGVVINRVMFEDEGDIMDDMTDKELAELQDQILCSLQDEYDDYGDYLYDLRKDYEMEQRATARSLQADPDGRWK